LRGKHQRRAKVLRAQARKVRQDLFFGHAAGEVSSAMEEENR
jgi:hypothetical protein